MRPLFSFFQALTLPIGVYATEADFTDYHITSEPLASTAWVNTTVRDGRQVPPERATTFSGRVINSSFFNSGSGQEQ